MPRSAPQPLLLTFFSGTQTALPFVFLLPFALFSLLLLSLSVLFLFSLAFFSLCLSKQTLGFLLLLGPLSLLYMLGLFGLMLFLLALRDNSASFLFLCVTGSRPLVLVIPLFDLLLVALLDPALGWLAHRIGLLGPLFCHHVSAGYLLSSQHCCVHCLLAAL
jgi:hypothetical protein